MSDAASFYNSLFAVEFAVLGILIAGVFLFLQIAYQDRLYRFIAKAPRKRLVGVGILELMSLGITATGALFTAFPNHHFIWFYHFSSTNYVLNPWFAISALILTFVSTTLSVWVAIAEILSLQPSGLIKRASHSVTGVEIRRYLIKDYGLQKPFHLKLMVRPILGSEDEDTPDDQDADSVTKEEKTLHDRLIADAQAGSDPFQFIGDVAIRAIRDRDGVPFENALDALLGVYEKEKDVFVELPPRSEWDPNSELADHLVAYLLRWVSLLIRECRKENAPEFAQRLYDLTGKFASRSLDGQNQSQAIKLIAFWKTEADRLASNDVAAYAFLVRSIKGVGERIFSNQDGDFEHPMMDEVFRSLGWLMQRLMSKQGVETKPLMRDDTFETPYDILYDTLMSFSWQYNRNGARFYPLIFFDAIRVSFDALVDAIGKDKNESNRQTIYQNLYDCASAYSEFAESAILAGNGDGAALATMHLQRCYEDPAGSSAGKEIERLRLDVIGLMIGLALFATGRDPKSITSEFMVEGIDSSLLKTLSKVPDSDSPSLDKEVTDAFLKTDKHVSHDAVTSFLRKLGRARNSSLGLNL